MPCSHSLIRPSFEKLDTFLVGAVGFEPTQPKATGLQPVMTLQRTSHPVVTSVGFEPTHYPGLSRTPLPSWGTRPYMVIPLGFEPRLQRV